MALSNCYSEINDFHLAEDTLKKALEIKRDKALEEDILYNLGNALFDQKKYLEASYFYKKVISTNNGMLSKMARKNLKLSLNRAGIKKK